MTTPHADGVVTRAGGHRLPTAERPGERTPGHPHQHRCPVVDGLASLGQPEPPVCMHAVVDAVRDGLSAVL